jgi:hypothetical protein
MAMLLDIFDEFLIFLRGPGTFLEATLVTTRRSSHFLLDSVSYVFPLKIYLPPFDPTINCRLAIYIRSMFLDRLMW